VLCRPPVAAGFRLAGLTPIEALDRDEVTRHLTGLMGEPEVGVVLIEESLYAVLPDELRRALAHVALPMVVPFPSPSWAPEAVGPEAFITELLQQAIGYRVRLG
jgi:vacuolar-type H+-ATPase subunit F/Vma7